ncbi:MULTISPECIES: hypothetical protein [Rhodomicrobium]|uniref:hypothetical protein n=1 Tax=Rhodomicrobium TaxID=1068 RepID=UPI000B4A5A8E|nr:MULTISPECIES: hypothetical protein [Rhodomicrobium]
MHGYFAGYCRLPLLALAIAALPASLKAQQPPPLQPGTEATEAVGSQVQPMKPDCPPATEAGDRQKQHPPTAGLSEKVPTMTPPGDCPVPAPQPGTKSQPK